MECKITITSQSLPHFRIGRYFETYNYVCQFYCDVLLIVELQKRRYEIIDMRTHNLLVNSYSALFIRAYSESQLFQIEHEE